jgi:tRNA (guanine-N7-)-methyltransferase
MDQLTVKNIKNLRKFMEHHPDGGVTPESFYHAQDFVNNFYKSSQSGCEKTIILDSGCGKGMSTVKLAKLHPQFPVIGIDRSRVRLKRNKCFKPLDNGFFPPEEDVDDDDDTEDEEIEEPESSDIPSNALLLHGELSAFWKYVCIHSDWIVHKHFLLYPNPLPKKNLVKNRFTGSRTVSFW